MGCGMDGYIELNPPLKANLPTDAALGVGVGVGPGVPGLSSMPLWPDSSPPRPLSGPPLPF